MNVRLWCMATSIALATATAGAETMTIATFQDPSPNGTLPLFSYDSVPAQAIVGEFLGTFQEFPPRQEAASFSLDQVMEKLQTSSGSK